MDIVNQIGSFFDNILIDKNYVLFFFDIWDGYNISFYYYLFVGKK